MLHNQLKTFTEFYCNWKAKDNHVQSVSDRTPLFHLQIHVNSLQLSETRRVGECFARLTTVSKESWDKHQYKVIEDPSQVLTTNDDQLCVKATLDFESSQFKVWVY